MGTIGSYYLNGPNLATSTGIYTDVDLLICAPIGYYSQGGIVRELNSNCILLAARSCPSCSTGCGGADIKGESTLYMYLIPMELGTATGAIKVSFSPENVPDGIRGIYNNVSYNEFSSEVDGYHQTTVANGLTYMGNSANVGNLITDSPHGPISETLYYNGAFAANGNTTTVVVSAGSASLTTNSDPLACIAYIPKTSSSPTTLSMQIAEVVASSSPPSWTLSVGCPALLLGLNCTTPKGAVDCTSTDPLNETMYLGKVSGFANIPVVYDWAFADNASLSKKSSGQYIVEDGNLDKWIVHVDANGIISTTNKCADVPSCTNLDVYGVAYYPALYIIPMELGSDLGVIKVEFYPGDIPDGIRVIYDNAVFNEFSSEIDGYHQTSVTNGLTYMGNSDDEGGLVSGSPYLATPEYAYSSGAFSANGSTTDITVSSTSLTTGAFPGACIAYIPRTTLNVTTLSVEVASILDAHPILSWRLKLFCPEKLTSLLSTRLNPLDPCDKEGPFVLNLHLGKVSGAADEPVVHDWAFADEYASTKFSAGTYGVVSVSGNSTIWAIVVDSNGIITSVTLCSTP